MAARSAVQCLIGGVRRRRKMLSLASGVMSSAALLLVVLLLSGLLHGAVGVRGPMRTFFLAVCAAALTWTFVRGVIRPLLSWDSDDDVALQIEHVKPDLRNRLLNSVQLARERADGLFSTALIQAYLRDTSLRVENLRPQDIVDPRTAEFSGILLGAVCLLLMVTMLFKPNVIGASVRAVFFPADRAAADLVNAEDVIETGDITVRYVYPAYSRMADATFENTSGTIRALKGTEVRISARVSRPVTAARMVINETEHIPMAVSDGMRIEGRFSVLEAGNYRFEFTASGRTLKSSKVYGIFVEADEPPAVDLLWPAGDLTAGRKETIPVSYHVRDDFGVSKIELVTGVGGDEVRRVIGSYSEPTEQIRSWFDWNLSSLDLRGKKAITYCIEAWDNDAVSGPKSSRSAVRTIRIYDARKHHEALMAAQEVLLKRLLHLLATDLTHPLDPKRPLSRGEALLAGEEFLARGDAAAGIYDQILAGMKEDELAGYGVYSAIEDMRDSLNRILARRRASLMEHVRRQPEGVLAPAAVAALAQLQEEQVELVEGQILTLNSLLTKQKLDMLKEDSKAPAELAASLKEMLGRLRDKGDLDELAAIADKIEDAFAKVAEKLASLMKEIPPNEFLNPDAADSLGDILDKLREAVRKGDREEALRLAEELLKSLAKFNTALDSAAHSYASAAFGAALQKLDELGEKLEKVRTSQQAALDRTKVLKQAARRRCGDAVRKRFDDFFKRQEERLKKIEDNLRSAGGTLNEDSLLRKYGETKRKMAELEGRREELLRRMFPLDGRPQYSMRAEVEKLEREMDKLRDRLARSSTLADLEDIRRKIPSRVSEVGQIRDMLKVHDVQEALDVARRLAPRLQYWEKLIGSPDETGDSLCRRVSEPISVAAAESARLLKDLLDLRDWAEDCQRGGFTAEERKAMRDLAEMQRRLGEEAGAISQEMEKVAQKCPFLGPDAGQSVRQASGEMRNAESRLDRESPASAVPHQRESVRHIAEAQDALKKAREKITKGMTGKGMPMPFRFGYRPGYLGAASRIVPLPQRESQAVPGTYRKEILDAMRGPTPKRYEKLNKDYYKRLLD